MRRGRVLIIILLIVVIGLAVGYVAIRQFLVAPSASEQQTAFVEIYIAGQNIPQGEKVTEAALQTITIPQDKFVQVMYTKDMLPSLVGSIAKYPIDQGVVITSSMLGNGTASIPIPGPQWAALIPTGMTAISVPADKLALSGYAINNGAHVNINACFLFVDIDPSFQTALPNLFTQLTGTGFTQDGTPIITLGSSGAGQTQGRLELEASVQQPYYLVPSEAQRPRMVCQILLQNVVVLKVGDFPSDPNASLTAAQPAPDQANQDTPPVVPDIVTLLVSPQDSITLSYLIHTDADLSMTLRNPVDDGRQPTEASTLQFLLSQYNIPVPAKLPYSFDPYTTSFGNLKLPTDANVPVQ
ncbi:MAG: SAF domain-containing protein [Anaerolineales bacterium]